MAATPTPQHPSLDSPVAAPVGTQRSGRRILALVVAICAAPVLASYFSYYVLRPSGRTNYGSLIQPQRAMPADAALPLVDLQGKAVLLSALKGQWLLVSVSSGDCKADCQQHLYLQRQLREVLGKDKDRLDRVWLINDQQGVAATLLPALRQSWVLRAPAPALAAWLQPAAGHALQDHLYLVDPMGNWMMRFPAQLDPSRAKKDLERLMKASESWDQAGR